LALCYFGKFPLIDSKFELVGVSIIIFLNIIFFPLIAIFFEYYYFKNIVI
jgi:hypothetical protein